MKAQALVWLLINQFPITGIESDIFYSTQ